MFRFWVLFSIMVIFCPALFAGNTASVRVALTIPTIIEIEKKSSDSSQEEAKEETTFAKAEEQIRQGQKVLVKTIVPK